MQAKARTVKLAKVSGVLDVFHSLPVWVVGCNENGERPVHPRFGPWVTGLGGWYPVEDRLKGVRGIAGRLVRDGVLKDPDQLLSAGHTVLEVWHPRLRDLNDPRTRRPEAIEITRYRELRKGGQVPRWSMLTAPVFGIPGAETGGPLSDDPAQAAFFEAIGDVTLECGFELMEDGLFEGSFVIWPAFMAIKLTAENRNMVISHEILRGHPRFEQMAQKIAALATKYKAQFQKHPKAKIRIEIKLCDPRYDFLMTLELGIAFCERVNKLCGFKACCLNLEMAHIYQMRIWARKAYRRLYDLGSDIRFNHANFSNPSGVNIEALLQKGILLGMLNTATDWDHGVHKAPDVVWADYKKGWSYMVRQAVERALPVVFEQDYFSYEEPVVECAIASITATQRIVEGAIADTCVAA